jgi:hypothetical protein
MRVKSTPTTVHRGNFGVGQLVKTNAAYRRIYPRSLANRGIGRVMWFCRGTELRVMFPGMTNPLQIDERFLEAA